MAKAHPVTEEHAAATAEAYIKAAEATDDAYLQFAIGRVHHRLGLLSGFLHLPFNRFVVSPQLACLRVILDGPVGFRDSPIVSLLLVHRLLVLEHRRRDGDHQVARRR